MANLAIVASIYGGMAVVLGAFGTHELPRRTADPAQVANWNTAVQYHLIHSVVLLVVSSLLPATNAYRCAGWLFVAGMTLFSGSIYALVLDRRDFHVLGPVTPLGGFCLIAGWAALAWGSSRRHTGLGMGRT